MLNWHRQTADTVPSAKKPRKICHWHILHKRTSADRSSFGTAKFANPISQPVSLSLLPVGSLQNLFSSLQKKWTVKAINSPGFAIYRPPKEQWEMIIWHSRNLPQFQLISVARISSKMGDRTKFVNQLAVGESLPDLASIQDAKESRRRPEESYPQFSHL